MQVANNQCFVIWSSKIEGRIDPHFYKPYFSDLIESFKKSNFDVKTLKQVSEKITSGSTPKSGGADYTSKNNGIAFVRSGDISEDDKINFDDILYVKKEIHERKLKSSQLKKGDVLIATVGATIGAVSVYNYDEEANINQAIALVRCKENINPQYIKAFMLSEMGQKQLDKIKRPVARANINLDEVGSFKIPVPPLETQNKIVEIMQSAYDKKAEKEQKAESVFNSIDDYILEELNIELSQIKEEKCFSVNFSDIKNNRLDPHFFKPEFINLTQELKKGKTNITTFGKITKSIINGFDYRTFSDDGLPYLRVQNIRPNSIDLDDVKRIDTDPINKDIRLEAGNILLTRKGTFGVSVCLKNNYDYVISSEIFKIKTTEDTNSNYLSIILNSQIGQRQFNRVKIGAIMGSLSQEAIKEVLIPLPNLDAQSKIVKEVEERLAEAEKMRLEAKNEIEKAKIIVEGLILNSGLK